ncbi:substrate-binding domain-containing protein [Streptosporangium sp. NPDC002544]|uniref:sugar ABC transporter substrate-binding protein n=1 Tax=unclassified Streptosporangium TaxID=2632669 RepID=UPI00331DF807
MRKTAAIALASVLALGVSACSSATSAEESGAGGSYTYTSDQAGVKSLDGVALASTIGELKPAKKYRVAVILKALTNQYWQGIQKGAKAAADKYGVEVTIQAASSEKAQTEQLTIAQTLVGQKFDAYVVAPESTSNLNPALNQMRSQQAPVVNVDDARVPATVFIGPNHEENGIQAADELAKLFPDGGEVAQVEGQSGSSAAILRIKGFKEGIAKHPNLKLVASVPGNWDANASYAAAQQIIRQNPNLKGIYANNDTMAIGVAKAVQESGKKVAVIGTDGVPEAISGVRNESMAATVSPLPYYEGFWAVESAIGLLEGKEIAPWVVAPAQLITKENVDQFYDTEGQVITDLYK